MQDQINEFIKSMTDNGCEPLDHSQIIADDEINRYDVQGDKPKSQNGSYKLAISPDGFAFGWFVWWKDGITHNWNSKPTKGISKEERAELKLKSDAARKISADKRRASATLAATASQSAWDRADITGTTEYLDRKQIGLHGCRIISGRVLVPMRADGKIVSMQYIAPDGRKLFEKGGDQSEAYFSMGNRSDDLSVLAIVEGFSTGASVREAMGWPVIIAFNAGGLKPIAKIIRDKYPDARIVICGDNDHQTKNAKGEPWNVGVEKANQAAVAIGGAQVVVPVASDGVTDWNDVHCKFGLDAVRDGILQASHVDKPDPEPEPEIVGPSEEDVDPLSIVRPLGHNRKMYYFFPRSGGQVIEFSAGDLGRIQNLYQLAPRSFWDMHYNPDGKSSDSAITSAASAHLIAECQRKGIFSLRDARGIGVWKDKGEYVVNCGNILVGDGFECAPPMYDSEFVYEAGVKVIDLNCEPMGDEEALKTLTTCKRLSWKKNVYADILAGWLVIAPIGSALNWRPHITLTGQSGSGKSTVMDDIIKKIIGDIAVNGDGGSTEPGIRKELKGTGRPFLMDEAESESKKSKSKMHDVMELIRKASSGGSVLNANDSFTSNSCFCLCAINPNIKEKADLSRNTMIELYKDTSDGFVGKWQELSRDIRNTFNSDYSRRLFARTIKNLPIIEKNIGTFAAAAASVLGDNRSGDQMGALLAGVYSLKTSGLVGDDEALAIVEDMNLSDATSVDTMSDAEKLVMHMMSARVRFDSFGRGMESSLGELVSRANDDGDGEQKTAANALRGYGIKIEGDRLLIANVNPLMSRILQDTPWGVWARTLGDYPESGNHGNRPVYFGVGATQKVTSLPLTMVLGDASGGGDDMEMELEF